MTVTVTGLPTIHNADIDDNYNVPTNPFFTTAIAADTDRVFGVVVKDATDTTTINEPILSAGLVTEYSNLENTNGFTIRCYNSHTTTGLNLASIDLTVNDFFVLVHSDDANLHHMAKITEIKSADANGDMFEFEPKLGNQIAKDTKFMVFKGPTVSNKVVAITCGLIANPHNDVVCSKPLWYFYNDKLDKKNELNHSTKYLVKMMDANSGASIDLSSPTYTGAFITVNEHRNKIVDYSKFSYNIKTKDLLRTKDDPDSSNSLRHSEGQTKSFNADNYNTSFYNARRDSNNEISGVDYRGIYRYLTYATSPNSVNLLPATLNTYVQESIDGKAGFAETKLIDDGNIYSSKISIGDKYTVRQEIDSGTFEEWVEIATLGTLGASVSNRRSYSIKNTNGLPLDMTKYINSNDEIKIGNRILRVHTVFATAIDVYDFSRLETDSIFDTSTAMDTLAEDSKIYRRRFNVTDNTLLVDFDFNDSNYNSLKVVLYTEAYKTTEISVVEPDAGVTSKHKLLFLNQDKNHRGTLNSTRTGLQYARGSYIILNQVFTGQVENIETKIEDGVSYLSLEGRNTLSKLIDPITNKDTVFSEDIIYSSKSPFNDLTSKSATATIAFNSKTISSISPVSSFNKNDKIWAGGFFIGEVSAAVTNSSTVVLYDYPLHEGTGLAISVENNKKYIYNKALASNPLITSSSDLNGASDKGLFFKTGNRLSDSNGVATFNALTEFEPLPASSSSTHANARGYEINKIENILSDSIFSSLIDGYGQDILNTLIDFSIISVVKNNNETIVKLAPYVPLTLGRSQPNYANINDAGTYTSLGTCLDFVDGASSGLGASYTTANADKNITIIDMHPSPSSAQKTALMKLKAGDAIYTSTDFVGRVAVSMASSDTIILEKSVPPSLIALKELFVHNISSVSDKKQHDLMLTNAEHLHGGKLITLLGPKNKILNYEIYNNGSEHTYYDTFGASMFRLLSIEKGNIGPTFSYHRGEDNGGVNNRNLPNINFYENEPEYNYYATAYKGTDIVTVNKTGTGVNNGWPHEQCGLIPITGSNYYDRTRFPNTTTFNIINRFKYVVLPNAFSAEFADTAFTASHSKATFYHIDPNAARLFLFVNSDKYTYSSTRKDSLLNSSSVTLSDYGLMSIKKSKITNTSQTKESVVGNTFRMGHLDTSYNHSNILSSDKHPADLTRFGLMRLTECVYDWFWNPINPESETNLKKVIEGEHKNISFNLENVGSAASFAAIFGGHMVITFNAGHSCAVGDFLVDVSPTYSNNYLIMGEVTNVSGNDVTITALTRTRESGGTASIHGGTGEDIYAIRAADIALTNKVTGFADAETIIPEGLDVNLSKSIVFGGQADGGTFGFSSSSDWFKTFNGLSGLPTFSSSDAILPIFFEVDSVNYSDNPQMESRTVAVSWTDGSRTASVPNASLLNLGDRVSSYTGGSTLILPKEYLYHITAINTATNVITFNRDINNDATNSYGIVYPSGTHDFVFIQKRNTKIHHSNAFFRWWDMQGLDNTKELGYTSELNLLKATILQGSVSQSGISDNGSTIRLRSLAWNTVQTASKSYTYPLVRANNAVFVDYGYYASKVRSASDFSDTEVDGVVLGIKMSIYGGDVGGILGITDNGNVKGNNNATFRQYHIPFDSTYSQRYKFLQFVDLTGCYLVPIVGKRDDSSDVATTTDDDLASSSAQNVTANDIIYVVSHEYDSKQTSFTFVSSDFNPKVVEDGCVLTLDKPLVDDTHYKIMQPNPVAFWPNSPRNININEMSSKYTKQADSDKMYGEISAWGIRNGSDNLSANRENTLEGIQSMYVVVDVDNLGGSDNTVLKSFTEVNNAIGDISKEVCISDGNTKIVTSLKTDTSNGFGVKCEFGEIKQKLKGVVSVSETFELTVAGNIEVDDERALIGSTLNIVKESEDLVEELLKDNGVNYNLTKESYPIYASPDFQGASTYSVINYLLSLKDKKINDDSGTLDIVNTSDKVVKFTFTDSDILEFKQVKSRFNFYNEVTVYGAGLKATRKDIKSIKKHGRKTLEVFLEELITQEDVDKKAYLLLRIHSDPESNLELSLPIDKVKNITVGDIVNCEIRAGNVPMNQYIILETTHSTDGIIKLKLGRYRIGLDDTFAELLLQNKKDKSYNRKKNFSENENDFDFFTNIKIKEMQLTIRKRSLSGTTLGFENTLNTNGNQLGFGGSVTHTVLLEEDL